MVYAYVEWQSFLEKTCCFLFWFVFFFNQKSSHSPYNFMGRLLWEPSKEWNFHGSCWNQWNPSGHNSSAYELKHRISTWYINNKKITKKATLLLIKHLLQINKTLQFLLFQSLELYHEVVWKCQKKDCWGDTSTWLDPFKLH